MRFSKVAFGALLAHIFNVSFEHQADYIFSIIESAKGWLLAESRS